MSSKRKFRTLPILPSAAITEDPISSFRSCCMFLLRWKVYDNRLPKSSAVTEKLFEPVSYTHLGGVSALGAGLYSMGIPKDSIVKYETALKTDQFLLIVHGAAAEVAKAKDIIETTHPAELELHSGEPVAAV